MNVSNLLKEIEIKNIVYDSRAVKSGDLFCAIKGFSFDGNDFVDIAVKNGAVGVLSENEKPNNFNKIWIKCDNVKKTMAEFGKDFYGVDFSDIYSVAVTGTNGKTSVATICDSILANIFGEENTCLIGTIGNKICGEFFGSDRTTPEAIDTLRIIGSAKNKIKTLCMEASSHALVLDRLTEFYFDSAIFTNLTQDHLDFHETMEEYYSAKKRLFTKHIKNNGAAIINIDDEYGKRLIKELKNDKSFSIGFAHDANYRILTAHCDWKGIFFKIKTPNAKILKFRTKLIGHFNVINCAQAVCGLLASGIDEYAVIEGLEKVKPVEGRIDKVELNSPFSVIVDYAHTPDALVKILSTAKKLTKGNLIAVFGAGGNRDKTKRPLMGDAVAKNCDFAVLTSDNPRNENPQSIIDEVKDGFPIDFPHVCVIDRKEAIKFAFENANEGDAVIIAGKGHEKYQETAGVKHRFDDKETAKDVWEEIKNHRGKI
ncbi:MAG: UDP-N-acetylmuramoyl-L-alanyl-D-glutamate--2,6-diaminopimelate ligase [Chitinispirillales bacterium]|jgi:UDP-N-acetylmuramoyl-L-alanyl-D-glutamate--2,6-diaminopimelate ligase|nr:UDP-N-acetylmuramoyl-L-alanyl-D-glutamate--2,6-diaminopimelate ligase [Chitinispirillales bacterium]